MNTDKIKKLLDRYRKESDQEISSTLRRMQVSGGSITAERHHERAGLANARRDELYDQIITLLDGGTPAPSKLQAPWRAVTFVRDGLHALRGRSGAYHATLECGHHLHKAGEAPRVGDRRRCHECLTSTAGAK